MVKVNDILIEKHYTGPLYHATGPGAALSIFNMGQFQLGVNYIGGPFSKANKSVDNFGYYMSTSRDKLGTYRVGSRLKLTALFVINPNNFNQHDIMALPYDDFGGHGKIRGASEAEEMILSKKDFIPIDGVVEQFHYYNPYPEKPESAATFILQKLKDAISNYPNIEYYYYSHKKVRHFKMLDTRKAQRIQ